MVYLKINTVNHVIMSTPARARVGFGRRNGIIGNVISLETDKSRIINTSRKDTDKEVYGRDSNGNNIIHSDAVRWSNTAIKSKSNTNLAVVKIDEELHYTNKSINGSAINLTCFSSTNANTYTRPSVLPTDDDVLKSVVNARSGSMAELPKSVIDFYKKQFRSKNKFGPYGRNLVENTPGKDIRFAMSVLSSEFTGPKKDNKDICDRFLADLKRPNNDEDIIDLSDKSGFTELCDDILTNADDISVDFVDYDDMVDGGKDSDGFIKVVRKLVQEEEEDFIDPVVINNNEEMIAGCKHNDINLNNWSQVKEFVDTENISDGRYLCNNCLAPIACQHLENLFNNRPIETWSITRKGNVYCKLCQEFIGHVDQFSGTQTMVAEFKYEMSQATMSAIHRACSILVNGNAIADRLRTNHFKLIYDEMSRFDSVLHQRQTWDIKQVVIMYGAMFVYIFITIYVSDEGRPVLFIEQPNIDIKKLSRKGFRDIVMQNILKLSSQDNMRVEVGQLHSYITPEFDRAFTIAEELLAKKMTTNREMLAASRSSATKKKNAMDNFTVESILKRRFGLSDRGIAATMDIEAVKKYNPGKQPKLRIKHELHEEKHVYKKTVRDITKSEIARTRSIMMIYGCEGDLKQEHIWDSDNSDNCKRCNRHYKELASEDDSKIKFLLKNEIMFQSMKTILVAKCPEFWGTERFHEGDPCVNCGWPEIENQEYIDKYSYIFYNMIDTAKLRPLKRAPRKQKLYKYSLDNDEYQQQPSLTFIAHRLATEQHLNHLLAMIKHLFHLNSSKLGLNIHEVGSLFNLLNVNKLLFDHKPQNATLSNIVNAFTKSYDKGVDQSDVVFTTTDSLSTFDNISFDEIESRQLEGIPELPDNEDEHDQLANQLSDADEDEEETQPTAT